MLVMGDAKSTSLAESQAFIKFIFSPRFVGLEIWDMQQSETPFLFLQFQNKTKTWDFHTWNREIGILLDLY